MDKTRGQNENDELLDQSAIKDPKDWKSGDDPATASQVSYIETLSDQAGEDADIDSDLTKAKASEEIDRLRKEAGHE